MPICNLQTITYTTIGNNESFNFISICKSMGISNCTVAKIHSIIFLVRAGKPYKEEETPTNISFQNKF
jgi:hypothetical protein